MKPYFDPTRKTTTKKWKKTSNKNGKRPQTKQNGRQPKFVVVEKLE
jgi:hypothetical protein